MWVRVCRCGCVGVLLVAVQTYLFILSHSRHGNDTRGEVENIEHQRVAARRRQIRAATPTAIACLVTASPATSNRSTAVYDSAKTRLGLHSESHVRGAVRKGRQCVDRTHDRVKAERGPRRQILRDPRLHHRHVPEEAVRVLVACRTRDRAGSLLTHTVQQAHDAGLAALGHARGLVQLAVRRV